ncbi:MAG: alkaline shock response membrane anchor protein AmaP [Candidatus Omnitrophica bacterium]|nr:alkaline shock response membrane anchor protein AmaP [Candidatus Omnitrophota bacterium]
MKIITKFVIYCYTIVLFTIGALLISFALGKIDAYDLTVLLKSLDTVNARLATGLTGLLIILIGFVFSQIMFSRIKREKTIAFQTASGEVLVALNAVEDLIRKLTGDIEGIKEARPNVIASKKGIEINLRLALNADVHIPEFTGKVQELIKERIQEILGIDEAITVKIFVTKILAKDRPRNKKEAEEDTSVPFRGYKR